VIDFTDRVLAVIAAIEPGDVWTYGEVAEAAGRPGAARAVGRMLATVDAGVPWWRVVTSTGRLVPGHETITPAGCAPRASRSTAPPAACASDQLQYVRSSTTLPSGSRT
jgi:hypothetical protein